MTFWGEVRAITSYELLIERRSGETWSIIAPFAAAALMTIPLAIGINLPLISSIGWPIFWSITLLFGMQVAWRHVSSERNAMRDVITLLGVDPAARFTGRVIASGALLSGFMLVIGALTVFLYTPAELERWPLLIVLGLLFAAGLAQLATLASDLTVGLGARSSLAPLLVAPLALPLLIGAAQATDSLLRSSGILPWLLILVLADLLLAIVGVLTARPLQEAAT
ncbi:MAG TPA: heme exporter protein CcmB [Acidimicrobiia bacterium]|nr:heme exporter protein CcmB [Acidimicrobiia bacterium]